jgi:hypothetical protein
VHIPDAHGIWMLMLQFPLPSHVGVISVSTVQVGVPQTVSGGWNPAIAQVARPESQEIIPTSHAFERVHIAPAVQGLHAPW